MLKIEALAVWLHASPRSISTPIRLTVLPETPDAVIVLSDYGGYPLETEDVFDVPTFQVRCRGVSAYQARDIAHQVDAAIIGADVPFTLGTGGNAKRVIDRGRVGGAPSYMATDETRGRTEYVANYWIRIER